MQTIWFIRHGESEANVGWRTEDPAGVKLTDKGREQARLIAQSFPEQPSLIVTSPYIRTTQTALPTLQRFAGIHHEVWLVQEFTYLSPCSLENTTSEERRPLVEEFWNRRDPSYIDGEGAESFASFMGRVHSMMERIRRCEGRFIAIFSHEQFIHGVLWSLIRGSIASEPNDISMFRNFLKAFAMPNGSILKMRFGDGEADWSSGFVTSHLL